MGSQHLVPPAPHSFTCVQVKELTMGTISRQFVNVLLNSHRPYSETKSLFPHYEIYFTPNNPSKGLCA